MHTFSDLKKFTFETLNHCKYVISNLIVARGDWSITHVELMDSHPLFRQKIVLPLGDFTDMLGDVDLSEPDSSQTIKLNSGGLARCELDYERNQSLRVKNILGFRLKTTDRLIVGRVQDLVLSLEDGKIVDFVIKAPYKGMGGKEYIFSPLLVKDVDTTKAIFNISVRRKFMDKCPTYDPISYDFIYRRGLASHYDYMHERMSNVNRRLNNYGVYRQVAH